jgi:hypothetical protein
MKLFTLIFTAMATVYLGSTTVLAQDTTCHSLVIQVVPTYQEDPSYDSGFVRAQIYARPSGTNDRVFMVFGQEDYPLAISSNALALNNSAGWTNEIDNAIQTLDEEVYVNDSYVTLGQFTPTALNPDNTGNNAISITRFFPIGSAGDLLVTDVLRPVFGLPLLGTSASSFYYDGADEIGWGIESTSMPSLGANSLPDTAGLVALAQITLPRYSSLSGTINFKVQPNSNSNLPTEIATVSFDISAIEENLSVQFANAGGGIAGCTDETACNFNAAACVDDESCEFESCVGCTDEGACNFNDEATVDDDSCEYTSCEGCTDEEACNYDPEALIDDGSCVFPGCTDGCACNFDPNACADDGSCEYEDVLGNCGGDCSSDLDGDDICDDVDECVGMMDSCGICNGPGAIFECGCSDIPEGDCDCDGNQLDAIGVCGGDCLADEDGNGICDVDEVLGCTVEEACNYDANATLNDGSCDFLTCLVFGCTDDAACNYDDNATVDNGTCLELDACGVCGGLGEAFQCGCANIPEGDCDCDGNQLDALGVCGGDCLADNDGDGLCDAEQGCTYDDATNYNEEATVDDGTCEWCRADLDGNGLIQLSDLLSFLAVYNTTCE